MRRVPVAVWILLPLALGALYYLAWPLLAPTPTLATVVPRGAVLTHRFRDLAALNDAWLFRPRGDPRQPGEAVGESRNLADLAGVDPHGPFHIVYLPLVGRNDPTVVIFPVGNARALRQRFEDPDYFLEKGFVRHAQHLAIRGDFAAVGGDRDAVRRLGEAGLTAPDLGEDHVVAVDVPGLLRFALTGPTIPPWRQILAALGFVPRPPTNDGEGGAGTALEYPAGRVLRVHDAWRSARLWSWGREGRLRLDLQPAPGRLAALLKQGPASGPEKASLPSAPPRAVASLFTPGAWERTVMAWGFFSAGVAFPEALADDEGPLGPWGRVEGGGALLMWAVPTPGSEAWTVGVAAASGTLPALGAFHRDVPDGPGAVDAAEGSLALTWAPLWRKGRAPAGRIVRTRLDGLEVLLVGGAAQDASERFALGRGRGESNRLPTPPEKGLQLVATFSLLEAAARQVFRGTLGRGGLFHVLEGGDVEGAVWTDGAVLRVEARVRR